MNNRKPLDTSALIQRVANYKAKNSFTDCKPENLEERKIEGLGLAISQWSEWGGRIIMEVFKAALEDANFHDEAEQVQEMLDKLMEGR